jgi:hypothetical protein
VAVLGTAPGLPVVHSGRIPAGCDPGADGGRCLSLPEIPILLLNFVPPVADPRASSSLLNRLADTPAMIVTDLHQVLVQNPLAEALLGDQTQWANGFAYQWFTNPDVRRIYPEQDHDHHSAIFVADLHPSLGEVDLRCDRVFSSDERQRLLWFSADDESVGQAKLESLKLVAGAFPA